MKLKISFLEIEMHNNKSDFAQVYIDDKEPQIWFWDIPYERPICYEEFVEHIDKVKNLGDNYKKFTANFDYSKLEEIAYQTPIYVEKLELAKGIIRDSFDRGGLYEIVIEKKDDWRTLIHEFSHLCSDIPLGINRSQLFSEKYRNKERAVEIATEVVLRNDKNIFDKIKEASVKGMIEKHIKSIFDGYSLESFERFLRDTKLYPYRNPGETIREMVRLPQYLFYDELKKQWEKKNVEVTSKNG